MSLQRVLRFFCRCSEQVRMSEAQSNSSSGFCQTDVMEELPQMEGGVAYPPLPNSAAGFV